uniref:Uncharacterized protein n=1 Tax=Rhodopseudomonas palustris (strain BisA53) TaxID=316055 RepID=Q07KZ0_RHOP5
MSIAMVMPEGKKRMRTLWARLCGAPVPIASSPMPRDEAVVEGLSARPDCDAETAASAGVLLQFPVRGEALLVRLAEALRRRIADRCPQQDPLWLTLLRCPGSLLVIDAAASVAFDADRSAFHVAIEVAPQTTITLDTTDFDMVVNFVAHYVAERLADPAVLEAAS